MKCIMNLHHAGQIHLICHWIDYLAHLVWTNLFRQLFSSTRAFQSDVLSAEQQ